MKDLSLVKQAIDRLEKRMLAGDFEAAEFIAEIGIFASSTLAHGSLFAGEDSKGFRAIRQVAEHSENWPVVVPAIHEMRQSQVDGWTPDYLGDALPIMNRRRGRKGRALNKNGQGRMALEIYKALENRRKFFVVFELQARHGHHSIAKWEEDAASLPPFSTATINRWAEVGREALVEDYFRPRHHLTIFPAKLRAAIKRRQEKETISEESALRTELFQWLKEGFGQLAKSSLDHSGE